MKNVVINACYGGFGLSRGALLKLRELKVAHAINEPDYGKNWKDGSGPRTQFIGDSFSRDIARDDPDLVSVVREMGSEANGTYAKLRVVEIPVDVDWEIEEYDGSEHVAEKHRIWS